MMLRPLYESWLFQASQGGLTPWRRAVLERALAKDEALRCLAAELAEFGGDETGPNGAPDLRARLRECVAQDGGLALEQPLFPSPWIPAGAVAVLVVTGLVALTLRPAAPSLGNASPQLAPMTGDLEPSAAIPRTTTPRPATPSARTSRP